MKHRDDLYTNRQHHSSVGIKKQKRLQALQKLVLDLKSNIQADENIAIEQAEKAKYTAKIIQSKNHQIATVSNRSSCTK